MNIDDLPNDSIMKRETPETVADDHCTYCGAPPEIEHDPKCDRAPPAIQYEGESVECVKYDLPPDHPSRDMGGDRDHCGHVEAGAAEFIGEQVDEFAEVEDDRCPKCGVACGHAHDCPLLLGDLYAEAARSNMEARSMIEDLHAESSKMTAQLQATAQQRDFAMRQIDSLVQRLAGAHVAQGLIDMAAAQGFVQKEILPINQALAQIGAQPEGE